MANPQPTDAHLRMAHSINEAIMMRDFTKRQRKILDLVLRLSWGCGKKDAYIPWQRDFSVVGVHEVDIKAELNWLEISKIVVRQGSMYWFNKDFEEWEVSRVKPYQPERLSELLSLNLNGNRPELSETLRTNLVKHEVSTKCFTKFVTPDLASSKETLKKVLNKEDIYINNNYEIIYKEDGQIDEENTIIHQQSLSKVHRILRGEEPALESNKRMYRRTLKRLGI